MRALLTTAALLLGGQALAADAPPVDPAIKTGRNGSHDVALIFGNAAYQQLPMVMYANDDARSFRDFAISTLGINKRDVVFVENADRATMVKEIKKIGWKVRNGGTIWFYFVGHGAYAMDTQRRLLLASDVTADDLEGKALSMWEVTGVLKKAKRADRIVIIVDAGFDGIARDGIEIVPGSNFVVPDGFTEVSDNITILAAAEGMGSAQAYEPAHHGLFTYLVLGGLRGWADGELDGKPDGKVTVAEVQAYAAWTSRQLGRVMLPSVEKDATRAAWVLNDGQLEAAPPAETLKALALADRAERFARVEAQLQAEASAFWTTTMEIAQTGGDEGKEALQAFIDEYADAKVTLEWAIAIPEVRQAHMLLQTFGQTATNQTKDVAQQKLEQSIKLEQAAAAAAEPCDDLVPLEVPAMSGSMTPGQVKCLENRLLTERLQTNKDKISRLMLSNAEASGNQSEWERLIERHLKDIDRSDPDMCMVYAIFLFKQGGDQLEDAIRWADVALENKHVWGGGEEYVKRVNSLSKLRAESANLMWQTAEKAYSAQPTEENAEIAKEYRGVAMDYAREWLDYARAAGIKADRAYNLCTQAAGTDDFCKAL